MFQDGQPIHPHAEDASGSRTARPPQGGSPIPQRVPGSPRRSLGHAPITHWKAFALLSPRPCLGIERHSRVPHRVPSPLEFSEVGKGRFVSKSSSLAAATRGPPCHCRSPRYHRGGQSVREGQELFLPSPVGLCAADGLRSALLHCSSFRNFHSPCRVLCTFRSPYLCNIG